MVTARLGTISIALFLVLSGNAAAQELIAISGTAEAITGDIYADDGSISFANGAVLALDDVVGDTFAVDGRTVNASVHSVLDPADPVLLNGNRLCGMGPVTYVAWWTGPTDYETVLAVFTTQDIPASSAEMCASYTYEYAN